MARTYTAGIVTAYGAAKEAGYTGTYEEFCEQQAGFAENAAQVAEDRAAVETIKNTFETVTVPAAVQTVQTEGATQAAAVTAKGTEQVGVVNAAGDAQTGRVQMAGAEEVQDIETAGTTQVGAVNTAGATQVNAVNAAGTTQTGNVNDAGATQMAAIEAKGEETRESIPEDYSTLTAEVSDLKSSIELTVTPTTVNTGKYVNANGELSTDGNYDASDFIDISIFVSVAFSVSFNSARGFAFYKSDKTTTTLVVNGNNCSTYGYTASSAPQIVEFEVPNETVYLRFTRRNTYDVTTSGFAVTGYSFSGLAKKVNDLATSVAVIPTVDGKADNALSEAGANTDARKLSFTFNDGGYIASDGTVAESSSYSYTDYIFIGGLKHISFPLYVPDGSAAMVVVYNAEKQKTQFVQNISDPSGTIREITFTDADRYVRFSCFGTRKSQFYIIADKIAESIANACRIALGEFDDPDSKIIYDGGMTKIFDKIGVIGDSLSSGEMAYGDAQDESTVHYVDMYYYSWIQYLSRTCGTTAYNFSQGGMNTRGFLANLGGYLTKLRNPDYKCKAYFIALCHNDDNYGVPVGSPSDINISDPTQDADTFYGNYARIIYEVKQVEPNAKIFCICSKLSSLALYNVAIRYMATIFSNVYILDFENYFPKLVTVWEYTQGHGNTMGYLNYSWQIGTYVDWIIRNNRADFKYVQFIGTEYAQYIPSI